MVLDDLYINLVQKALNVPQNNAQFYERIPIGAIAKNPLIS